MPYKAPVSVFRTYSLSISESATLSKTSRMLHSLISTVADKKPLPTFHYNLLVLPRRLLIQVCGIPAAYKTLVVVSKKVLPALWWDQITLIPVYPAVGLIGVR